MSDAPLVPASSVGAKFLRYYFQKMQDDFDGLHDLYLDNAVVTRILNTSVKADASAEEVTGPAQIQTHLRNLGLHLGRWIIFTIDSQFSLSDSVLLTVSGVVVLPDAPAPQAFVQTFLLARGEANRYSIRNDLLRYVPMTHTEAALRQHVPAAAVAAAAVQNLEVAKEPVAAAVAAAAPDAAVAPASPKSEKTKRERGKGKPRRGSKSNGVLASPANGAPAAAAAAVAVDGAAVAQPGKAADGSRTPRRGPLKGAVAVHQPVAAAPAQESKWASRVGVKAAAAATAAPVHKPAQPAKGVSGAAQPAAATQSKPAQSHQQQQQQQSPQASQEAFQKPLRKGPRVPGAAGPPHQQQQQQQQAGPPAPRKEEPPANFDNSVHVSGLPVNPEERVIFQVRASILKKIFSKFGRVLNVWLPKPNFAFIEFADQESAHKAIADNGVTFDGVVLTVTQRRPFKPTNPRRVAPKRAGQTPRLAGAPAPAAAAAAAQD